MTLPLVGPYLGFVSGTFQKMLAYRLRYYTGIVSYLIYVAINYFIWKAVFADRAPGALIDGYDLAGMTTYVAVGWIARSFYFNNVDREIGDQVQKGEIALALARPVSYQGTVLAGAIGEGTFRFLCFSLPRPPRQVWAGLLDRGVLVRDVSGYPTLDRHLRVTVGTRAEDDAFLAALAEVLG